MSITKQTFPTAKVYVKFKPPKTLKAFLMQFFGGNSLWGGSRAVSTYRNKECTKIQAGEGRLRSPWDVYACAKTYFPDLKLETFLRTLVKLRPNGHYIHLSYCFDIKRPVISWSTQQLSNSSYWHYGKKGWSWDDLLGSIGIKSAADLYK